MRSKKSLAQKNAAAAKRAVKRANRKLPTIGYVLFEGTQHVVIATLQSDNEKTGNMVQIWILHRWVSPVEAVKLGLDAVICFNCPLRGTNGFQDRTCYVEIGRAPQGIWEAYTRGRYAFLPAAEFATSKLAGRKIRFGAYGDPVLIPIEIFAEIARVSNGWTGYTHQWRRAEFQEYRAYLMASCDNASDFALAHSMEWRTFRVRGEHESLLPGEITCPASDEMAIVDANGEKKLRTQCERCELCNGSRGADVRKSIVLKVHGKGARNFVTLDSIRPAAAAAA